MILGIGIDLLAVARVARQLDEEDGGFRTGLFTPAEIAYCDAMRYPARHYAARWAAKEALFKALGGAVPAFSWRHVEVERAGDGPPHLVLKGPVKDVADRLGVKLVAVSLSHTDDLATASVVLEG